MGWENVFQCENDPYCVQVLKKNFPNVKRHGDIYNFNATEYRGTIDVLSGGFPCQKYSHAGYREGDEPLAKEMLRIIDESRPGFVVAENVYGFFSIDTGKSLRAFCSDLQAIGYEAPAVLDLTSDFAGLQTVERHIWIVSKANGNGYEGHIQEPLPIVGQDSREIQGTGQGIIGRRDIRESRFQRVGERTSRKLDKGGRQRLKAVGNGYPPQVAFEIFKAIEAVTKEPIIP